MLARAEGGKQLDSGGQSLPSLRDYTHRGSRQGCACCVWHEAGPEGGERDRGQTDGRAVGGCVGQQTHGGVGVRERGSCGQTWRVTVDQGLYAGAGGAGLAQQ